MTNKEAIEIIRSDLEMAAIPGEHLEAIQKEGLELLEVGGEEK